MSRSAPSVPHMYARSSSTLSASFNSRPVFHSSVYKPPRSSPLAGPAISLNDGGDEDGDAGSQEHEKTRTSAMSSRIPSPYPTPPRTPSPASDNFRAEVHSLSDTPYLEDLPIVITGSERAHSKTPVRSSTQHRSPSPTSMAVDVSSRLNSNSPSASSPQLASHAYVRTPFSAPPTMRVSHPTYNTDAITRRAPSRPHTAPSSSSSSSTLPRERGTFSAPDIIRPVTIHPGANPIRAQLDSHHSSLSIPPPSSRHTCPSTSMNPELNWITSSNHSPPPFSRARLKGVTMPVKAGKAGKLINIPGTKAIVPILRSPLTRLEVGISQPIEAVTEETCQRLSTLALLSSPIGNSHDRRRMQGDTEEPGDEKASDPQNKERRAIEERQKGTRKWKQLLKRLNTNSP